MTRDTVSGNLCPLLCGHARAECSRDRAPGLNNGRSAYGYYAIEMTYHREIAIIIISSINRVFHHNRNLLLALVSINIVV